MLETRGSATVKRRWAEPRQGDLLLEDGE